MAGSALAHPAAWQRFVAHINANSNRVQQKQGSFRGRTCSMARMCLSQRLWLKLLRRLAVVAVCRGLLLTHGPMSSCHGMGHWYQPTGGLWAGSGAAWQAVPAVRAADGKVYMGGQRAWRLVGRMVPPAQAAGTCWAPPRESHLQGSSLLLLCLLDSGMPMQR